MSKSADRLQVLFEAARDARANAYAPYSRFLVGAATPIHVAGLSGVRASFTLDELLPHSFGPEHLPP